MHTCTHICAHMYKLKEQGPCSLVVFFFLVISALLWSPWGSVLSLVSLQSMGRPGKVRFRGDFPSEAVSFLAAHFDPDLHGEEPLPSAPGLQTSSALCLLGLGTPAYRDPSVWRP